MSSTISSVLLALTGLALLGACSDGAKGALDTSAQGAGGSYTPGDTSGAGYDGVMTFSGELPWNVLMISLDTTRVEDLGRYSGLGTTPRLDALFEQSVVLDKHRSCSNWTFASTVCFMGGGWDLDQGFVPSADRDTAAAPDSLLQAAEVLGDAGWSSYLLTTNPFLSDQVNNAQGFDNQLLMDPHEGDAAAVTERAAQELVTLADGEDAWYFHVHYLDPHDPYDPPEAYLGDLEGLDPIDYDLTDPNTIRDLNSSWDKLSAAEQELILAHIEVRYRGELSYVDAQIGGLLDQAEAGGYLEHTLVVFWTDHGEQRADHGHLGHDYDLYDELNRSVVAFSAPGLEPGAWSGPTTHSDIWPTILEILPWDFGTPFTGLPVGSRGEDDPRFGLKYIGDDQTVMFVEQSEEKLIYYWSGRSEYYSLGEDPSESADHFDAGDPTVQSLWSLLSPKVAAVEALYPENPASSPGI